MFMCVQLNSLFDSEMKVYYITQVLKQGIKIETMSPNNYIRELRHEIEFIASLSRCMDHRIVSENHACI